MLLIVTIRNKAPTPQEVVVNVLDNVFAPVVPVLLIVKEYPVLPFVTATMCIKSPSLKRVPVVGIVGRVAEEEAMVPEFVKISNLLRVEEGIL